MTISDFKRRWVLSKINPILFYLPLGAKKIIKNKAHIIISPRTQIEMNMFTPYSFMPDKSIPYYTFYPKKEETVVTGSFKKYKSYLSVDLKDEEKNIIPTYGCCYRIYKKEINEETGETSYISVKTDGELDLEDSFDSLHFNQQSFYLPEGEYYYYEEVSSEGDMLFFDTLKIIIFKKDEEYKDNDSIIKDYTEEETPIDVDTLYIHYLNLDDNQWHETFNGYKGYTYQERNSGSSIIDLDGDEEPKKTEFKYFIYHKPKCIKTYTKFEEVSETFESVTKVDLETYGQSIIQGVPWTIGPMGEGSGEAPAKERSPQDNFVPNLMYKIVPKVYKIKIMDKEISEVIEKDIKRTTNDYIWSLTFAYNWWRAAAGMYDSVGWALQKYKVTFPSNESHKVITIGNTLVSSSYIMSYSQYQINRFPHAAEEEYGILYSGISPSPAGSDTSNLQTPQYNIGVGIAIQRDKEGATGKVARAATDNELGENIIEITKKLNDTIYEIEVKTGVQISNISWTNMNGESGSYVAKSEPNDTAQSYASAEDCAYFAMRPAKVLSKKYDKDNPDGYCAFLCEPNASHIFYEITAWEDNQGNPQIVDTRSYNTDTAYVVNQPLYTRKSGDDHKYWRWDQVKNLKEGCGVSILFTRQTRGFYKEWTGETDSFEVKDTYIYKGKSYPYTVETGKEKNQE